jgi:hypothetical protein
MYIGPDGPGDLDIIDRRREAAAAAAAKAQRERDEAIVVPLVHRRCEDPAQVLELLGIAA